MSEEFLKQLAKATLVPDGIILIISAPTGKTFWNDTNGVGLVPQIAEGVLIRLICRPYPNPWKEDYWFGGEQEKQLFELFDGAKIRQQLGLLKNDDADAIDLILSQSERTRHIKIDRTELGQSCEAWLKVVIENYPADALKEYGEVLPTLPASGYLTWLNSD